MSKKIIPEEFIRRAQLIHNYKYDYRLIPKIFNNNRDKVPIICPIHGVFSQMIQNHLRGQGCPKCGKNRAKRFIKLKKTTSDEFIKNARKIHGDFYDYSLVPKEFNIRDKVPIICPIHGVFRQTISNHLKKGQGCLKCGIIKAAQKNIKSLEQFIVDARKIWGDLYDYNDFKYKGKGIKGEITCKIHGNFLMTPNAHLNKHGCPKCKAEKTSLLKRKPLGQFIKEAHLIHGDAYNYELIKEIKNNKEPVPIICKIHGIYNQSPNSHLRGNGCPHCNESHGERKVVNYLIKHNIKFERQKKI